MLNKFTIAFNAPDKLLEIKEKKILQTITAADELCEHINKFLPYKFLTNHGANNEEEEENEVDPAVQTASSEKLFGKTSRARTIEELHKRIENMRGKTVNYKEKLVKKGLKNRLKKKTKMEERKQLKNKSEKLLRLESEKQHPEPYNQNDNNEKENSLPIENNIQFNKLILPQSNNTKKPKNDPKSLLAKLEKKKMKLKKLEMKGKKEKLTEIKSKDSWDAAIQKAEGIKVKDDVDLLKKSMMRIKNRKNKSKKKWDEREKNLEQKKEKVQMKRKENIDKKRKERIKKRTKILVKKGRILPK